MALPRINSFKADPTGWIGSGVMLAFAAIAAWRWAHSGLLYFSLIALRDLAAAWFLVTRKPNVYLERRVYDALLAYASSALPLMYLGPAPGASPVSLAIATGLFILGFALASVALIELGASFGISPGNRGLVRSGLYRWLRHPMYLGYLMAEIGFAVLNPANSGLLAFSSILYFLRAAREKATLERCCP